MASVAVLLSSTVSPVAIAGDSWFSRVNGVPASAWVEQSVPGMPGGVSRADSVQSVFDIEISLEADPQGDDDSTVDDGANDADQRKYERAIREFADGFCQSTNLGARIGKVRVFRDSVRAANADVVNNINCAANKGPRANVSGFGVPGQRVWMCDNWAGYGSTPLIDDAKGWGYTLAHEFGHYLFGLYDEYRGSAATGSIYQPRSGDTPSNPSLMNNQWCAANPAFCASGQSGNSAKFLEFSTDQVAPYNGSGETAQKRVFGESGWETLVRSTTSDPKAFNFLGFSFGHSVPPRTRYTSLLAKSPLAGPDYAVTDSISTCQDNLEIIWMQDELITYLLLDTSGSMFGTPIANAKTASNLLISQLPEGSSAIGVGQFGAAGTFGQVYAITDIPDPDTGVRAAAQTAVNGLFASGGTPLFEAGLAALPVIENFATASGGNQAAVLYMLTDGVPNSTTNQANMINAYVNAGIPIITFGFGSGVNASLLSNIATSTGGQYFQSPTTLAEIQAAFLAANAAVSSSQVITQGSATASSAGEIIEIPVDDTLLEVFLSATYSGVCGDVTASVLNPSGAAVTPSDESCTASGGEASLRLELDEATIAANGSGLYQVVLQTAGGDIEVDGVVGANPKPGGTYSIALNFSGGQTVTYPQPLAIQATVLNALEGQPLTGLEVTAEVTEPGGNIVELEMLDDGQSGDLFPGDGVYGAIFNYRVNGQHTVTVIADNTSGNAQTSTTGMIFSPAVDGSDQEPESTPVSTAFQRSAQGTLSVASVIPDDHGDDPTVPGACTAITDDNTDTGGRIDLAGDVDCFAFTPADPASDLSVRTTGFVSGMDAVVTVYNADGLVQLAQATGANTASADSGVIATIPAADIDPSGIVVTVAHSDDTADSGGYLFSAGPAIFSDTPLAGGTTGGGSSSSGSLDPWTLIGLAGLAGLGAAARRRRAA
jgi:uncharacterized protein YegL